MPQDTLFQYLKDIGDGSIAKDTPDCSVTDYLGQLITTDTQNDGVESIGKAKVQTLANSIKLISTTDFFYPLVEDPYL